MKRIFFLLVILFDITVFAQPGGGGDPGGGEPVPIQGVALLLLAGAWLGFKKWSDKRR